MNQVVVTRKYSSLRFIGSLLKMLAWISLVMGALSMLVTLVGAVTNSVNISVLQPQAADALRRMGMGGGIVNLVALVLIGLGSILGGIVAYLVLMAAGDQILVLVETEHNTRAMVELMTRLVTLQTPLPAPPVSNPPAVAAAQPPKP